jgi:hypothetical protein
MVLDPISAVGLARNIVQFLDFAKSIISESHAVYHSAEGTKDEFVELEAIARHIQGFTSSLTDPNFETKTADAFDAVRKSCLDVAIELSGILNSLKVNPVLAEIGVASNRLQKVCGRKTRYTNCN